MENRIHDIETYGTAARGRKELVRHMEGNPLQRGQAIHAKCYDCTGYFIDGKLDCLVTACPLHSYMPYKGRTAG